MAATQNGTGSLTVGGQATPAALVIDIPSGAIVESVTENPGGSPDFEDVMDVHGAFHTRITYEKTMKTATVFIVGVAYPTTAGNMDGPSTENYYIESVAEENSKGPVRTTITATLLPTV